MKIPDGYRKEMLTTSRILLLDLRVLFISVITGITLLLGILFGLEHMNQGSTPVAFTDFFLAGFSLLLFLFLIITRKVFAAAQAFSVLYAVFLILLILEGAGNGFSVVWAVLYPPAVFFLTGIRSGFLYSLITGIVVFSILFTSSHYAGQEASFQLRILLLYIINYIISFFYEIIRSYDKKLIKQQIIDKETAWNDLSRAMVLAGESDQQKKNALTDISHRALTPLNGIIGCMQLLDTEKDENLRLMYFKAIEKSSEELAEIVKRIVQNPENSISADYESKEKVSVKLLLEELSLWNRSLFSSKLKNLEIHTEGDFSVRINRSVIFRILTILLEQSLHWSNGRKVFIFFQSFGQSPEDPEISALHSLKIVAENQEPKTLTYLISRFRRLLMGDLYQPEAVYSQGPSMTLARNLARSQGYFVRFQKDPYGNLILELSNQDLRSKADHL